MHRAIRAGTIAIVLCAAGRGGPARAEESQELPVDITGNVNADAIVPLGKQVGPVVFHEVLLQDHPTAKDLREANPDDTTRPKPILVIDNLSSHSVLDLGLRLEDEAGQVLASCGGLKVEGKEWKDVIELCRSEPRLRTADWPRVKVVRIVGTVRTRG